MFKLHVPMRVGPSAMEPKQGSQTVLVLCGEIPCVSDTNAAVNSALIARTVRGVETVVIQEELIDNLNELVLAAEVIRMHCFVTRYRGWPPNEGRTSEFANAFCPAACSGWALPRNWCPLSP